MQNSGIKSNKVETRIAASVAKGLTELAGRENSVDSLKKALEIAQSGSGQVVGIVGETRNS